MRDEGAMRAGADLVLKIGKRKKSKEGDVLDRLKYYLTSKVSKSGESSIPNVDIM